jgi:hypothetical protein
VTRKYFDPNQPLVMRIAYSIQQKYRKIKKKLRREIQKMEWAVAYRILGLDPGLKYHKWIHDPKEDAEWLSMFYCAKCGFRMYTTKQPKRNSKHMNVPGKMTWPRYDKRVLAGTKRRNCEEFLIWQIQEG